MNKFPYTNGHELNLDWILQVVKEFQTQYQNIDSDLQNALAQIAAAAQAGLDSINAASASGLAAVQAAVQDAQDTLTDKVQQAIAILNGKISDAEIAMDHTVEEATETLNGIVTDAQTTIGTTVQESVQAIENERGAAIVSIEDKKRDAMDDMHTDRDNCIAALQAALIAYQTALNNVFSTLYTSMPADSQMILGRLNIINDILNGAHPGSFQWLQGNYVGNELHVTTDNTWVSTTIFQGAAARRIIVHCANGYGVGKIGCWYELNNEMIQGGYAPVTPEPLVDYIVPNNTVYTAIQIRKIDLSNLTPSDMIPANVAIDFPVPALELPPVLATVEESSIATRDYLENAMLIYNNDLFRALVHIPINTALSSAYGGNLVKTNIADAIHRLNWISNIADALGAAGQYTFRPDDMESGQWSFYQKAANTARGRTAALLPIQAGSVIEYTNTTFDIYMGVLAAQNGTTYQQTTNWLTGASGSVTINNSGYLTLIFRNHADTTADVDPSTFDSVVTIKTPIKRALDALNP